MDEDYEPPIIERGHTKRLRSWTSMERSDDEMAKFQAEFRKQKCTGLKMNIFAEKESSVPLRPQTEPFTISRPSLGIEEMELQPDLPPHRYPTHRKQEIPIYRAMPSETDYHDLTSNPMSNTDLLRLPIGDYNNKRYGVANMLVGFIYKIEDESNPHIITIQGLQVQSNTRLGYTMRPGDSRFRSVVSIFAEMKQIEKKANILTSIEGDDFAEFTRFKVEMLDKMLKTELDEEVQKKYQEQMEDLGLDPKAPEKIDEFLRELSRLEPLSRRLMARRINQIVSKAIEEQDRIWQAEAENRNTTEERRKTLASKRKHLSSSDPEDDEVFTEERKESFNFKIPTPVKEYKKSKTGSKNTKQVNKKQRTVSPQKGEQAENS
jgi:hypothetical protein